MKIRINKPVEVEVSHLVMKLPDRFEDLEPNTPCYDSANNLLTLKVVFDSGEVVGWPKAQDWNLDIYLKVVDTGTYRLLDPDGNILSEIQDYVPRLVPNEFGDYVDLKINDDGFIDNWPSKKDFSQFFPLEIS